jgi:adenylate cyclase
LIPFVYQLASLASLVVLQWTLGGYVASSAVSLWALVAAIGTLFFFSANASIPWFLAFIWLSLVSGLLEPLRLIQVRDSTSE